MVARDPGSGLIVEFEAHGAAAMETMEEESAGEDVADPVEEGEGLDSRLSSRL
jgi:hypothetical protein